MASCACAWLEQLSTFFPFCFICTSELIFIGLKEHGKKRRARVVYVKELAYQGHGNVKAGNM